MAKQKPKAPVQNRTAYSRMSYLYQAASYLARCHEQAPNNAAPAQNEQQAKDSVARRMVSEMRAVALKTQVRIDPSIKRRVCRYCDSVLIEGESCTSVVENKSKHGSKPWADVLVTKCRTCGREKRVPVGASRQKRRPFREVKETGSGGNDTGQVQAPENQNIHT